MAPEHRRSAAAIQQLYGCIFSYYKSVCLKAAVDLAIPDALHRLGGRATSLQLHSALSLPPARLHPFARLMRAAASAGIFSGDGDDIYALTPVSRLLVGGAAASLSPTVSLFLHPHVVAPNFHSMADWLKGAGGAASPAPATAFEMLHGATFFGMAAQDAAFGKVFNAGMAADSRRLMDAVLREHGSVFAGVERLVDVGGGLGGAAAAIAEAFPEMKCAVLDLPHVVKAAPAGGRVEFVGGDMFVHVPPADAVLLKWVLHDWDGEDCRSILKRCKEAIPADGKVIIIDIVVGAGGPACREQVDHFFDLKMMQLVGGQQRDEHEWRRLFTAAGFSDCKVTPVIGSRSIIELFP